MRSGIDADVGISTMGGATVCAGVAVIGKTCGVGVTVDGIRAPNGVGSGVGVAINVSGDGVKTSTSTTAASPNTENPPAFPENPVVHEMASASSWQIAGELNTFPPSSNLKIMNDFPSATLFPYHI